MICCRPTNHQRTKWKIESLEADLSRLRELVREMREAARELCDESDYQKRFNFPSPHRLGERAAVMRSFIAKSDALIKEHGEPVKYGCHYTDGVVLDDCHHRCAERMKVLKASDCEHWKPIK